jgi:molecular chaperone GrpE
MENPEQETIEVSSDGRESNEVEQLKEQLRREHEMYLRNAADFDNYRKRVEREIAGASRAGKREILLPLLEALDGFDRALETLGEASPSVLEGIRAIQRRLLAVLEAQGVIPFDSAGQSFDPKLHEVVAVAEGDEAESRHGGQRSAARVSLER